MSEAEGAQDDIQVGAAAGVNDPGDIPWCATAWSAGEADSPLAKVAKRARENRKKSSSVLSGETVTFDPQWVEIGENSEGDGAAGGKVAAEGGSVAGGGVTLTPADNERLKRLQMKKARNVSQKASPRHKGSHGEQPGGTRHKKRTQKQLDILSRP